jgi:hypothetical protein
MLVGPWQSVPPRRGKIVGGSFTPPLLEPASAPPPPPVVVQNLIATASSVAAGGPIDAASPTLLTPDIVYFPSPGGENLIVWGYYVFANDDPTDNVIVEITVAVTGQPSVTFSHTVIAGSGGNNGFSAVPFCFRYTGVNAAPVTVDVTAKASIGGVLTLQAAGSTVIERTTT